MKWKKSQYRGESSFGKKVLIFLIIIVILIGVSYYFDFMETQNKIKKLFTSGKEKVNDAMNSDIGSKNNEFQPHTPEINLEWCKAQNIPVDESETSPVSIQIVGSDNIQNCCIKNFKGYNNCLNQSAELEICYTSNIGGTIKSVKLNNKYVNPYYYQRFIQDIHKSYNPHYNPKVVCDLEIYKNI